VDCTLLGIKSHDFLISVKEKEVRFFNPDPTKTDNITLKNAYFK
jgi:hypothetical protein